MEHAPADTTISHIEKNEQANKNKKKLLRLFGLFMHQMARCHSRLLARFAAVSVLERSIAMVIGPTPPGTGVIAEAILLASS